MTVFLVTKTILESYALRYRSQHYCKNIHMYLYVSVPLKHIAVKTNIQGFIASVETTLTYKNDKTDPIEAVFTFPTDESSAVYRFEVLIDGKLIVGECQDKDQVL